MAFAAQLSENCDPCHSADILRVDTALLSKRYNEDCMTLAATNKNLVPQTTTPSPTPAAKPPSGWDPFEVWRTRVLLPRLAEERAEKAATTPALSVKLVRA